MAAPTIANTWTQITNTNENSHDISVNDSSQFAVGDLIILIYTVDSVPTSPAVSGLTGMTERWLTTDSAVTHACYTKELVSGDTSVTTITVSWTGGGEKGVFYVYRIAAAEHDGLTGTPSATANGQVSDPDLPAITLDSGDHLVFGTCGMDANATVSTNPTGYTTENEDGNTGGGLCNQWVGTDVLGGSQSANGMTLSRSDRNNVTGIIAVKEVSGGGAALVHFGNETVGITEGTLRFLGLVRIVNETEAITEGSLFFRGLVRQEGETVEVTEGSLNFLGLVRLVAETVSITEGTLRFLGLVRQADETVTITEGSLRNMGLTRIVNSTVSIIEGILRNRGLVRVIDSTVNILEGTIRALGFVRVVNETVNILEGSLFFQGLVRIANETVSITGAFVHKVMEAGFGAIEYARYTIVPKVCASAYKIVSKITGKYKTTGSDEIEF